MSGVAEAGAVNKCQEPRLKIEVFCTSVSTS